MSRTEVRQEDQISASNETIVGYDDSVAPSLANYQTNPAHLLDDLNNIRSMLSYLKDIQAGNWYDIQTAPTSLDVGTLRGVDNLNDALHLIEKKRWLREVYLATSVTVPASSNLVVLALSGLPANTTAAVGSVITVGTVVAAHGGTFGTHSLSSVPGANALNPKNLLTVVNATTHDPILSSNRIVWGLLQTENATDGHTMTGTTPNRAQISFVRVNVTGTALEACPVADIQGLTIRYLSRERVRLQNLGEQDFLPGAVLDVDSSGSGTDEKVKATGADTTPDFLFPKLAAGTNVTLTILNPGANEQVEISAPSAAVPPATCCGQVLYSIDGLTFSAQLPLTGNGWLQNDSGTLLVVG